MVNQFAFYTYLLYSKQKIEQKSEIVDNLYKFCNVGKNLANEISKPKNVKFKLPSMNKKRNVVTSYFLPIKTGNIVHNMNNVRITKTIRSTI